MGNEVFNGDGHTVFAGGIVGSYEKGRAGAYLQNVLNYGSIVFAGTAFEEVNAGVSSDQARALPQNGV